MLMQTAQITTAAVPLAVAPWVRGDWVGSNNRTKEMNREHEQKQNVR